MQFLQFFTSVPWGILPSKNLVDCRQLLYVTHVFSLPFFLFSSSWNLKKFLSSFYFFLLYLVIFLNLLSFHFSFPITLFCFLYCSCIFQLFFSSPFHFHPIYYMYYFFIGIPLCGLLCLVLFCKGDMLCLIHFFCICILCSTNVTWFLWYLLWYYFHTFWYINSFPIYHSIVCNILFFSCISSFILFLVLSIAFPFTFFFHFNLLVEVTSLISIWRSFAIFCTFW